MPIIQTNEPQPRQGALIGTNVPIDSMSNSRQVPLPLGHTRNAQYPQQCVFHQPTIDLGFANLYNKAHQFVNEEEPASPACWSPRQTAQRSSCHPPPAPDALTNEPGLPHTAVVAGGWLNATLLAMLFDRIGQILVAKGSRNVTSAKRRSSHQFRSCEQCRTRHW